MLRTVMGYLSAADATEMAAEAQAECLLALEEMDAVKTATRANDHGVQPGPDQGAAQRRTSGPRRVTTRQGMRLGRQAGPKQLRVAFQVGQLALGPWSRRHDRREVAD